MKLHETRNNKNLECKKQRYTWCEQQRINLDPFRLIEQYVCQESFHSEWNIHCDDSCIACSCNWVKLSNLLRFFYSVEWDSITSSQASAWREKWCATDSNTGSNQLRFNDLSSHKLGDSRLWGATDYRSIILSRQWLCQSRYFFAIITRLNALE